MAYIDQYLLGEDSTFQHRVQQAMFTAAVAIQGEVIGSMGAAQLAKRQALSHAVLSQAGSPGGMTSRFARLVAANPAVTGSSTDSDIQFTVNSLWDDVAGVEAGDH